MNAPPTPAGVDQPGARFGLEIRNLAIPLVLLVLIGFFGLTTDRFLSLANLVTIVSDSAVVGVLAVGMTIVLIVAGVDLSVGAVVTMTTVLLGVFLRQWDFPAPLGIGTVILVGALIGFVNGLVVVFLRVPAIIATLASMSMINGLALLITGGATQSLRRFGLLTLFGQGWVGPVPVPALVLIVVVGFGHVFLTRTVIGTRLRAIGENPAASHLMGLPVGSYMLGVYTACAVLASVAGIMVAGRLSSASAQAGLGLELSAIAAAVLGGTALTGGKGTVIGTLVGSLILSVLLNGLIHLGVPFFWQLVVTGLALVVAVAFQASLSRSQ
jgi:ribose/xylose/arabinose/galactoside ABC-type transport system permease subunit